MITWPFFSHVVYGFVFTSTGWVFGYYAGKRIAKARYDMRSLLDTFKQWEDAKIDFPHNCKWHCDICKDARIDCLIGVTKYAAEHGYMNINIKYCKDRATCVDKAHSLSMWYGEPVTLIGTS